MYTELPHHLNQNEKEISEHAINTSFAKKDTKSHADYRKSILLSLHTADVKFRVLHNFNQKLW